MTRRWTLGGLLLLAMMSCQKKAPLPSDIPDDFKLDVELQNGKVEHLSGSDLRHVSADYQEDNRRAWKIDKLVGGALMQAGSMEIVHALGARTLMPLALEGDVRLEPVLTFDRHGRTVVALIKPGDPFPTFHGRGGNRKRPGDAETRFREVSRVKFLQ